ncbi:hypothetical protein ACDY96_26045 [Rhizobium mongolense]|uniref:hypothetical protein n=1 Tax=Rhizobium mongolense TaxID=57676 RepID=UPI003555F3D0
MHNAPRLATLPQAPGLIVNLAGYPGFRPGGTREWRWAASRWDLTYSAITESGAPPQLAAKEDGDHKTPFW